LLRTQKSSFEIGRRQHAGMRVMSEECGNGLRDLQAEQQKLAEVTRSTEQRYAAFTAQVGSLVAGLQSHDSTRQRLEHIVESLRGAGSSNRMLELQIRQLDEARSDFLAAVKQIELDMERLSQGIAESAGTARELLGVRGGSRQSFI